MAVDIGLWMVIGQLCGAESQDIKRPLLTNWIQFARPIHDIIHFHKTPGDIPAPRVLAQDLERAVTNGWDKIYDFPEIGQPIARGFCCNNEGSIFSWKFLSGDWLIIEDPSINGKWKIKPSVKVSTNGTWASTIRSEPMWPSPGTIEKIIVAESLYAFDPYRLSDQQREEAVKQLLTAIENGRTKVSGTYRDSVEWRRRLQLIYRDNALPGRYVIGVLATKKGEMFLWELYNHKYVALQDSEGVMLLMQPDEKKP